MSYNPNTRPSGPGRKVKRVSDVSAMGIASPSAPAFVPAPNAPNLGVNPQNSQFSSPNQNFYSPDTSPNMNMGYGGGPSPNDFNQYTPQPQYGQQSRMPSSQQQQHQQQQQHHQQQQQVPQAPGGFGQQFAMFQQPMVQDMAMQYGQKLADQGKELVNKEFEKYIPVTKIKYYFAVDNKYVLNKLRLLFFPFTHRDWSLKYDQENPVQPRYDINAPDLYIPTMAYITYVVLAGFILGMQDRFSPEQLGIQASSALAYSIFEMIIYSITLYVSGISTTLRTLDLLAFCGYKFAIIVAILLISIVFSSAGYYLALVYCSLTVAFFLLRTLKAKVLSEPIQTAAAPQMAGGFDAYGQPVQQQFDHTLGRKRKLYFLFLVAGLQPLLSFWLTKHLI